MDLGNLISCDGIAKNVKLCIRGGIGFIYSAAHVNNLAEVISRFRMVCEKQGCVGLRPR